MTITALTSSETTDAVQRHQLGTSTVVGDKWEAIRMTLLRQAAARIAPATRPILVDAVVTALREIAPDNEASTEVIGSDLDALIGAGDLIVEKATEESGNRWLIIPPPPVFIRRNQRTVFVLGPLPLDESLARSVKLWGPYRELDPAPSAEELVSYGLAEVPVDVWLIRPRVASPSAKVAGLHATLERSNPAGQLSDLTVLDPQQPQLFYRGRFVPVRRQSGYFVGRRAKRWGGFTWIFIQLAAGSPLRFVDLPVLDGRFTGQDEARELIFALDAEMTAPQPVKVQMQAGAAVLSFFSPLPGWAERRLLTVGEPSNNGVRGSLMAIALREDDLGREADFLRESLWVEVESV